MNAAPTVAFVLPPTTANEGQTRTYNFTITDPDVGNTFTFVSGFPTCGSGNTVVAGSASIDSVAKTGTFQCSFADGATTPSVAGSGPGQLERAVEHGVSDRLGRQRAAVDRDQRGGERERGLLVQPDAGRSHGSGHRHGDELRRALGRRDTDTYARARRQDAHLRRRARDSRDHRRPRGRGRDAPRPGECALRSGEQRRAVDRDQRCGERERGLVVQPDARHCHRPGHRHDLRATSCIGATAHRHLRVSRAQDAHLRGRSRHPLDHGRSRRRGRDAPEPREPAFGDRLQRRTRSSPLPPTRRRARAPPRRSTWAPSPIPGTTIPGRSRSTGATAPATPSSTRAPQERSRTRRTPTPTTAASRSR